MIAIAFYALACLCLFLAVGAVAAERRAQAAEAQRDGIKREVEAAQRIAAYWEKHFMRLAQCVREGESTAEAPMARRRVPLMRWRGNGRN